jgi:uncharacterized repeat protein (TIGR01451 family)
MKRLVVRASALTGLIVVSALAAVQMHQADSRALAQEQQPDASAHARSSARSATKPKSAAGQKKPSKTKAAPSAAGRRQQKARKAGRAPAGNAGNAASSTSRYAGRYASQQDADLAATERPGSAQDSANGETAAGPDLFPESVADGPLAARDPFPDTSAGATPPEASVYESAAWPAAEPDGYAPGSVRQADRRITTSTSRSGGGQRPESNEPAEPRRFGAADGSDARYAPVRSGQYPVSSAAADAATDDQSPHSGLFAGGSSAQGDFAAADAIVGTGRPGHKQLEGEQAPALTIEKNAPEEVQIGKPAVFTIRVRNVGEALAHAVEIIDEVPHGTQLVETRPPAAATPDGRVVWSIDSLKPGGETTVEMELLPTAEGEIGSVASVRFASEASARTRATRPQLNLEVAAPREVLVGERVTLSIKLSNTGTGTATGIVISESIPEQLTHPAGAELEYEIGDLEPGQSRQLDLTMNAVKAGAIVNQLVAQGEGRLRVEERTELMAVAPQLELSMKGPKRRYLERQATYTMTISNPGTASAKEVELVTHLPKGMKFVRADNSGEYDAETNSVRWALAELPPNQAGQVTLTALPVETGELTMKVAGAAARGLSVEQEEVITIEGVAAILFQLADLADPIEVGGETSYEIRVVNQGSKAATNVRVVAVFPRELKPRSAEGQTRYTIEGQEVRFQPLAKLAPKADTTFQIRAQGLEPGDLRVQVQLMTDEMEGPVTKEESTRVYADE